TGKGRSAETIFVAGLTCTAIAEFTYFLGRAHPDNISHLCLASVVAGFYWLDAAWNRAELWKPFRLASTFAAFLVAGVF
ncbi:hypothetical protein ACOY39_28260, partial [Klebsiella pneumoniae]|uniref:hypothetical protein n=1 Tax=Klebsiella pneumoniae TaxID=573 RepID=UPI003BCB2149